MFAIFDNKTNKRLFKEDFASEYAALQYVAYQIKRRIVYVVNHCDFHKVKKLFNCAYPCEHGRWVEETKKTIFKELGFFTEVYIPVKEADIDFSNIDIGECAKAAQIQNLYIYDLNYDRIIYPTARLAELYTILVKNNEYKPPVRNISWRRYGRHVFRRGPVEGIHRHSYYSRYYRYGKPGKRYVAQLDDPETRGYLSGKESVRIRLYKGIVDGTFRDTERSWKRQYKVKKQWAIHKKNPKHSSTGHDFKQMNTDEVSPEYSEAVQWEDIFSDEYDNAQSNKGTIKHVNDSEMYKDGCFIGNIVFTKNDFSEKR